MTIEEILDKLEQKFQTYFFYRHITHNHEKPKNKLDIHSFVFLKGDKAYGGSLNKDYTDKEVDQLILAFDNIIH